MTVASVVNRTQANGNGSTSAFPFSFKFTAASEIEVYVNDTLKTLSTHYTLSAAGDSGTVTFVTSPTDYRPQTGEVVTIRRIQPLTQTFDPTTGGGLSSAGVEASDDNLLMKIQQIDEQSDRAPKLKATTSSTTPTFPEPSASAIIAWNAAGTDLENKALADIDDEVTLPVSSTDNAIVRFDGTTGKSFQNSGVTIDDSNNVAGVVNLTQTGYTDLTEISAPSSPAANVARLFARDVTAKTQLAFKDSTGTIIDLFRGIVDAKDFGASPSATASANTTAIQAAIDWCESLGGGRIRISRGSYSVTNINAAAASWDDDVALVVESDNIHIEGDGPGATTLTLANGSDCHVVKLGRRIVSSTPVADCSVSNLTIDGNRANQTAPGASDDHWDGINVATGGTRVRLENLYIHDTQHYGIGFQRGSFVDCSVSGVIIEDTGADGIDIKNDSSLNFGNMFTGVRVKSFGLAGGLSTDQAGIDIYGGVHAKGITVTDFGTTQGKCGVRFQSDSAGFTQSSAASLENFYISGDDSASTMGVRLNNHSGRVSNGAIYNCAIGFQIQQRENAVSNVFAESCVTGFQFTDDGGTTASACERNVLTGCVARSCTGRGFWIAGENQNALIGCVSRSNDVGLDIDASATDSLIIGCTIDSNVTSQIVDDGTRTTILLPSSIQLGSAVRPTSNDGAALGATDRQWSDLFLAEGGVINWDNGDFTMTQTGNLLDFAGGNVGMGGFTAAPTTSGGTVTPVLNVAGVGSIAGYAFSADANPTIVTFAKSRNATLGAHTIVQSGDTIGDFRFEGSDGANFIRAGHIRAIVDGTPGTNDMPGRIEIATTPDGSATPTARMRVDSQGFVRVLGGSFGREAPVTKTADFTLAATENWIINNKAGSACVVTLPAASSFPGREVMMKTIQAQAINSNASNVVPRAGGAAGTAIVTGTAGNWATLVSDGTNWVIMAGS
jgi:hypothetical protein